MPIARVTTYQTGQLIDPVVHNQEHDLFVSAHNTNETNITNIGSTAFTFSGAKVFNNPISIIPSQGALSVDNIQPYTGGAGVQVDNMLIQGGVIRPFPVRATFASVDTSAMQITTATVHGLTTADPVCFIAYGGALPSGLTQLTIYFARVISTTVISVHPTATDATNNTNKITLLDAGSGVNLIIKTATTPQNGQLWFDPSILKYQGRVNGLTVDILSSISPIPLPTLSHFSAPPVYVSATTLTVASIAERGPIDSTDIRKTSSTTVDVTTFGLNGILQSALLFGTIGTGGVSSTTITGSSTTFSTTFQVGDVIWTASGARRITAIASNTSLTVESVITLANGTAYKRGGLAPNTFYYLYAGTNNTTAGLWLSTRCISAGDAVADYPGGYSANLSRQTRRAIKTDGSSNIVKFKFTLDDWCHYDLNEGGFNGSWFTGDSAVLVAGNSPGSFTAIDCSLWVPRISQVASFNLYATTGTENIGASFRPTGSTTTQGKLAFVEGGPISVIRELVMNSAQSMDWMQVFSGAGGSLSIDVTAWKCTEVL